MRERIIVFLLGFIFLLSLTSAFVPEGFEQECSVFGGGIIDQDLTGYENCLAQEYDQLCFINTYNHERSYDGLDCQGEETRYEYSSGILPCDNEPLFTNECQSPLSIMNGIPQHSQRRIHGSQLVCCRERTNQTLPEIFPAYIISDEIGYGLWVESILNDNSNLEINHIALEEFNMSFIEEGLVVLVHEETLLIIYPASNFLLITSAYNLYASFMDGGLELCDVIDSNDFEGNSLLDNLCGDDGTGPSEDDGWIVAKGVPSNETAEENGFLSRIFKGITGKVIDFLS